MELSWRVKNPLSAHFVFGINTLATHKNTQQYLKTSGNCTLIMHMRFLIRYQYRYLKCKPDGFSTRRIKGAFSIT